MTDKLKILSIYEAVDGEANAWHQGTWSVFVRTAGCQVACRWCDTVYSWPTNRGEEYTVTELIGEIAQIGHVRKVTLTGGEPLEQPVHVLADLLHELVTRNYRVTIETAGTEPVAWLKNYHANVALVLDYKPPSAYIRKPMVMENFVGLGERHVIKFVVSTEEDFEEAVRVIGVLRPNTYARMVISPLMPVRQHAPKLTLAQWVEKMKLYGLPAQEVGLNLQLHKFIYPDDSRQEESGGVDFSG